MHTQPNPAFKGRKFLVLDIDGTIFRWSLMIHLFTSLIEKGKFSREILENAEELRKLWKRRQGSAAFENYLFFLVDAFESNIGNGLTTEDLRQSAREVVEENGDEVYVFARSLLRASQEAGYVCIALSHSPQEIVELFAKKWGFDIGVGTVMHTYDDGRYTGTRDLPTKPDVLRDIVERHELLSEGSIGMGNTTSDVEMILSTATPVLFNPTGEMDEAVKKALAMKPAEPWQRTPTIVMERTNVVTSLMYDSRSGYQEIMATPFVSKPIPTEADIRTAIVRHIRESGYKLL